ncbi:unnamed protein product [Zymoseptoria tritici ST99CH_1E4]|uniref:F-box domain-containing protein n=1 Tax=Zymoseptoria tritici ST99CH_1E4 TaxID=1276532 RepID=A0A2H1GCP9_ZYMTR|nr:unnamed protein product [Zymoseptoria tritici ST99CH_1E4]
MADSIQAAETAAADTHSPPTKEDTMDKDIDDVQATEIQPFRLLDLPDELWVRIGKMVVDDSPGIITPAETAQSILVPKHRAGSQENPIVVDEDPAASLLSTAEDLKYILNTYFPPPPAISQTNSRLRRELLAYYYKTKINLIFTWRDVLSAYPFGVWLNTVDPGMRRIMQGVTIIGFAKYTPPSPRSLLLLPPYAKDAVHVRILEGQLESIASDVKDPTWTDLVRVSVGVDFEVKEQSEYDASRGVQEYKGKLVFK